VAELARVGWWRAVDGPAERAGPGQLGLRRQLRLERREIGAAEGVGRPDSVSVT